jgi:hypothetical protein
MKTKIKKSFLVFCLLTSVFCLLFSGCSGGGGGGGVSKTLTTITISPTSATVVSGATQQFTVKGYDQNGAEMSFTPTFTVSPSELGTITISGQNGIFTGIKKGTGTIKVSGGNNITATANIEVITGPLNSLVISPTSVTLYKGQTQQFTVYGVDENGNAKAKKFITVSPTWSVIGNIGTIDNTGLFTATAQGQGQVKAEATKDDGTKISITANVTVANRNPVISSLTANPTSVYTGETSTITCTATDPDGDTPLTYAWTKTGGTISGSGSSVTYTAPNTAGTYTITVTVSDGKGGSATRSVDINVTQPSQEKWQKTYGGSSYDRAYSIQQTSDGGYIVAGLTQSFGAGNNDFYIIKTDANGNTGAYPAKSKTSGVLKQREEPFDRFFHKQR